MKRVKTMDQICVIGGGPSGMAAAISIAGSNPDIPVMIIEKNSQLGKKLRATGNGRCNISNSSIPGVENIIDFLNTIGIFTREEEDGRLYPFSGRADDVVGLLREGLIASGVEILTNFSVREVEADGTGFLIRGSYGGLIKELKCSKLVLAMGGKASPQFGTIGEGYNIARSLGLSVTKTFPGLTWVEIPKGHLDIQGVRAKGIAKLFRKGQLIAEEEGEIQFTKAGLSGICIFNLSSKVVLGEDFSFKDYNISLDLMGGYSINEIQKLLEQRSHITGITIGNILRSILTSPLEKEVLNRVGISLEDIEKPATNLSGPVRKLISHELKDLSYPIKGIGGWKDAQITIGGVSLSEVNPSTWESNRVSGLYIVGELLDKQGPCGGYNLHNAWKTGIEAGKALGK